MRCYIKYLIIQEACVLDLVLLLMSYMYTGQNSFSKMEMTNSRVMANHIEKAVNRYSYIRHYHYVGILAHVLRNQSIDSVKGSCILNKEVLLFGVILNKVLID